MIDPRFAKHSNTAGTKRTTSSRIGTENVPLKTDLGGPTKDLQWLLGPHSQALDRPLFPFIPPPHSTAASASRPRRSLLPSGGSRSGGHSAGWCRSGCGRVTARSFPKRHHRRTAARRRCVAGHGCTRQGFRNSPKKARRCRAGRSGNVICTKNSFG